MSLLMWWMWVSLLCSIICQKANCFSASSPRLQKAALSTATAAVPKIKKKIRVKQRQQQQQEQQERQQSASLAFKLQKCVTPAQVLQNVASKLSQSSSSSSSSVVDNPTTTDDDEGRKLANTILIRLSKQFMTLQNEFLHPTAERVRRNKKSAASWDDFVEQTILKLPPQQQRGYATIITTSAIIKKVIQTLVQVNATRLSYSSLDTIVEGTKAVAVLARLIPQIVTLDVCLPILEFWNTTKAAAAAAAVDKLQPHQLSGLHWSYDCFRHVYNNEQQDVVNLPRHIQEAYKVCNLPFFILPGYLLQDNNIPDDDLTVTNLVEQVPFQVDTIRTTSTQQVVAERRETAWLGDDCVSPFSYSGKSMPRYSWSPLVKDIRDAMAKCSTHSVYYDGCLLNHYPDGGSAMRYHIDPDQGTLWDYNTAVVSVGASRRVAFRSIPPPNNKTSGEKDRQNRKKTTAQQQQQQPHNFVVMHGDVMVMIDDCQSRFQHAVKPADNKQEQAARASLVFKKTLPQEYHKRNEQENEWAHKSSLLPDR